LKELGDFIMNTFLMDYLASLAELTDIADILAEVDKESEQKEQTKQPKRDRGTNPVIKFNDDDIYDPDYFTWRKTNNGYNMLIPTEGVEKVNVSFADNETDNLRIKGSQKIFDENFGLDVIVSLPTEVGNVKKISYNVVNGVTRIVITTKTQNSRNDIVFTNETDTFGLGHINATPYNSSINYCGDTIPYSDKTNK
jgi:hypothetical protein